MTFVSAFATATAALIASVLNCRFGWYADSKIVPTAITDQQTAFSDGEESGLKEGDGENVGESDGH
jgi:hypothetical protein